MQTANPNDILFSIATLTNDLPRMHAVERVPDASDFLLHEDDWSQLEFFDGDRLEELQQMLCDLKAFEAIHRTEAGWRKPFIRHVERTPLANGKLNISTLAALLGTPLGPAPILYCANTLSGQFEQGYSLDIGGNIHLYGYATGDTIPMLGAVVGCEPDNLFLTTTFVKLHTRHGLILVDWQTQMMLTAVDGAHQILIWQP